MCLLVKLQYKEALLLGEHPVTRTAGNLIERDYHPVSQWSFQTHLRGHAHNHPRTARSVPCNTNWPEAVPDHAVSRLGLFNAGSLATTEAITVVFSSSTD